MSDTPRPYKLIGCVQHDCEACIIRENQYKERCDEVAALRERTATTKQALRILYVEAKGFSLKSSTRTFVESVINQKEIP